MTEAAAKPAHPSTIACRLRDYLLGVAPRLDALARLCVWSVPCPACGQRSEASLADGPAEEIVCLASVRGPDRIACREREAAYLAEAQRRLAEVAEEVRKQALEALP